MTEEERYERARKRVRELRYFYRSLGTYVVVIVVLFIVDFASGDGWWVYWPALGWGAAVLLHAIRVFGPGKGSEWEERKIKEIMDRDEREGR